MADATATITGHAAEPKLRYTGGGQAVCEISLAVRRAFKRNDEWEEVVTWWKVQVWGEYAENVAASINKGDRVTCSGYPEIEEWEGREGEKRQTLILRADEVAANLKYARATVDKVERDKTSKRTGETTRTSSTGQGGRANRAPDPVYGEEEPFLSVGEHAGFRDMHLWV